MQATLKVAAEALAGLNRRRSPDTWLKRAFEATRREGPLEQAEDRMLSWLEERVNSATEREALKARIHAFRQSRVPESVLAPARDRIAREGGLTHQHARELGYASAADFWNHDPKGNTNGRR